MSSAFQVLFNQVLVRSGYLLDNMDKFFQVLDRAMLSNRPVRILRIGTPIRTYLQAEDS